MPSQLETISPVSSAPIVMPTPSRKGDFVFKGLAWLGGLSVFILLALVLFELVKTSMPSLHAFGWKFLVTKTWDPVAENYGALTFIYGTFVSSAIALLIAVPLSVGTALFLTDLAPLWLRKPLGAMIEMLASIPSVIWGLWAIFVLVPWLRDDIYPILQKVFGFTALFSGPVFGIGMLTAGIVVAIMILPIVTSVSREVLQAVPNLQREAAYALGATRWETTRIAVLGYAKSGLFGAAILGLGRALGETMAVTMVIGNTPQISLSLLAPGYTIASVIANEFTEATTATYLSALFELGLVLLGVTIVFNIAAQLMLKAISTPGSRRVD